MQPALPSSAAPPAAAAQVALGLAVDLMLMCFEASGRPCVARKTTWQTAESPAAADDASC